MWTQEHRKTYVRVGGRYPSDMTDAEWALLEPLIPAAKHGGRPRKTDMRAAINAILYLLRTGCPWRIFSRRLSAAVDRLQHLPQFSEGRRLGRDLGQIAHGAA